MYGARTFKEVGKAQILNFVCKVCVVCELCVFISTQQLIHRVS